MADSNPDNLPASMLTPAHHPITDSPVSYGTLDKDIDDSKRSVSDSTGDPGDDLLLNAGIHRSSKFTDLSLLKTIDVATSQLGKLKRSPEATNLQEIMKSENAIHVMAPSSSVLALDKLEKTPTLIRVSSSSDKLGHGLVGGDYDVDSSQDVPEIKLTHAPRMTRRASEEIVQRVTSARYVVDFTAFQRFVLLSYALRHNLVEGPVPTVVAEMDDQGYSPRIDLNPTAQPKKETEPTIGIFLSAHSSETAKSFKSQLWVPDDMEDFVDTQDLDALEKALNETTADTGIYIIEIAEHDFEHLKKEIGHKHISGRGTGKETVCGCYIERKCKGWRLLERRFRDRAFCVLVQNDLMDKFFGLHADLPADLLPTYDVGHIVMWPKDSLPAIDYKKLLSNVEEDLPYSWPHDILCSASQWRRIVFESQLKHLIKLTRMHSSSRKLLLDSKGQVLESSRARSSSGSAESAQHSESGQHQHSRACRIS